MTTGTSSAEDRGAIRLDIGSDRVGHLVFDRPEAPVNLLSADVLRSLDSLIAQLESRIANGQLTSLVLESAKEGSFIAGADVGEIGGVSSLEQARTASAEGQRIFRRLERLRVPTIASIHGTCLGGGTELSLHCDYRIASDAPSTKIGLPEVRLGIVPGFGGCVKLPGVIGLQRALDMILTGKAVPATRAKRLGLVDRVIPRHERERGQREFVADVLAGRVPKAEPRLSARDRLIESNPLGRRVLFALAARRVREETKGHYPAPLKAIEVLSRTHGAPPDEAYRIEADALAELLVGDVSRALVRVFGLSQDAKRALSESVLETAIDVDRVAVIGAGVMGGAIAEIVAANDIDTVLKDIDRGALDAGLRHAAELLRKAARARVFTEEEAGLKLARIDGRLDYEGFEEVDLAIEAVIEKMAVKRHVFTELEAVMSPDSVLATNTSSLSVTEMADGLQRPELVVGLHFFNPVHKMPLVEVIRGNRTGETALATAFRFALRLGKTPVVVADAPGFLVNRLLGPYLNEAGRLLEQGLTVEAIDGVLLEFGMPMGPCRLLDEIGFEVATHAGREMERGIGERLAPPGVLDRMIEDGRLGKKNGRGFYLYEKGKSTGVDPSLADVLGPRSGEMEHSEIRDRCLWPMVNEAAWALDEGVVDSPDRVDLAMIMGTGFPPFRGGLLRWADDVGIGIIFEGLQKLESQLGPRFAPAPMLRELAGRNGTFTHPS
ncbi:MAG: 3-hydroxyacyl-CoA dehydrogenase NAD-binding domain-containing protein [marine benthic group bacterium]|nr:3-hydroxyacyl-CoA dehydrogenase NAD-binding domain-containing protein [Gemmatimonadota bacterium]MCL7958433.1 3-hydroxyacyl-CoA dehydrogenase NAD-binding domain-containing protein [Gemmatimonadota bacterium]MCL7963365.1 3-hydroxyacyl-CoA dehydrogenase NAD-binding domain-containing protein [Candidatus Carthagonibacter metallireducens]